VKGKPLLRSPSRQVQRSGAWLRAASARARRSARIGWERQYDSTASRGVGGTKGRAKARASTARGNIGGSALLRRTSDRRFLSAFSSCQPDIVRPPAVGASCDRRCKGIVARVSEALRPACWRLSSSPGDAGSLIRRRRTDRLTCRLDLAGRCTDKT
jgi:hypothetical protein